MKVIDSHCHVGQGVRKRLAAEELLRRMDAHGVERAVITTVDQFVAVRNREGNDEIVAAVRRWPDRFWGMAAVSPWYQQEAVDELNRCLDAGLAGLKLNSSLQGFVLSDPLVHPLLEACRRRGAMVYAHTGTCITAEPFQVAELARSFPEVPIIMGHMGFADYWYDAVPAALQAENVLLETSLIDSMNILNAIKQVGASRVLFGSDIPESDLGLELEKMAMTDMTPDERQLVMHDNAAALWGGRS